MPAPDPFRESSSSAQVALRFRGSFPISAPQSLLGLPQLVCEPDVCAKQRALQLGER